MYASSGGMVGRSLKLGMMESFGWHIEGFGKEAKNYGFLGMQKEIGKRGIGSVLNTLGRALPLGLNAYFAYSGYQQGGVLGAVKEVGESVLFTSGVHYAMGAFGGAGVSAGIGLVGGAAALGFGAYALGEAGRAHAKGLRRLEMGQQNQDAVSSAGTATMRQRSVMALNNTHLNGRMAIGNEAALLHRSFGG